MIRCTLWLAILGLALGDESFFEIDRDFKAAHRQLLEVSESPEETNVEQNPEPEEPKKEEPSAGPTRFFTESAGTNPIQFLMKVKGGIRLKVFTGIGKERKYKDTYVLNKEAVGGITGSIIKQAESKSWRKFQVDIDWKSETFIGENGTEINGAQIEVNFNITNKGFKLTDLSVVSLGGEDKTSPQTGLKVKNKTNHGYGIEAPAGLSFACSDLGIFGPEDSNETTISVGVIFPDIQIQVGKVYRGKFGPAWECGVVLPIGLWVGILISLFFAIICCWGFTMLASINTMDRFDDPKGKSINVPNTD